METEAISDIRRKRLTAIVGHYGSGKTEFAVNLALQTAKALRQNENNEVYLVDLDIVNPYFRSRECENILIENGVKVLSSASDFRGVDLPYMPAEMEVLFNYEEEMEVKLPYEKDEARGFNESPIGILDIGGDPAGARVLTRYAEKLKKNDADVWCIINANRPMTKTAGDTIKYIEDIEGTSELKITGIINNTHLTTETIPEDIIRGAELAGEVSSKTGIDFIGSTVERGSITNFNDWISHYLNKENDELKRLKLAEIGSIIPIDIMLKKPWERVDSQ